MVYQNEIIEAFFFSTSVGVTENSGEVFSKQLPYLVSVESKWDEKVSPVYQVEYDFKGKSNSQNQRKWIYSLQRKSGVCICIGSNTAWYHFI